MPRSIPALVKPALLVWARERAGFAIEDAATKADIGVETLRAWEAGESQPSIPQLRKLGEIYKRPLAVFFLSEPPKDFDAQREFRRLPGLLPQKETPELRLALRTALFRREIARELYERLQEDIPHTTAVVHPDEDEEAVAQRVRELLGISWAKQLSWNGPYAALDAWRSAIERQGVLVFQTGMISVDEMRGISMPDGPLPVIVLNNADAPHGRIFTLLHEFIHILLNNGGHRTSKLEGQKLPEDQILERVGNRFAAAVLMPKKEFLAEAANNPAAMMGDESALKRFANRIKASPEAILRRLVALHRVAPSVYRQKRRGWQKQSWYSPQQGEGGPPIEVRVVSAIGRPFTSLVLEGYQRNAVSSADIVDYLGVQSKHLQKITQQLLPGPGMEAIA
ncbi:MAG TPA: XRE family transcriptional regulator [Verrucomicrobiae bacterium]|nr:XRE family transcriptional regulator [Verrucomicrobiae bacterium]